MGGCEPKLRCHKHAASYAGMAAAAAAAAAEGGTCRHRGIIFPTSVARPQTAPSCRPPSSPSSPGDRSSLGTAASPACPHQCSLSWHSCILQGALAGASQPCAGRKGRCLQGHAMPGQPGTMQSLSSPGCFTHADLLRASCMLLLLGYSRDGMTGVGMDEFTSGSANAGKR